MFSGFQIFRIYMLLCPTRISTKYDHFSLLRKQMDMFLAKSYIVRNTSSGLPFFA